MARKIIGVTVGTAINPQVAFEKTKQAAQVSQLIKDMEDLKYTPIGITSISNNVGTVELGSTVNAVTVNWGLNKTPASQKLDGAAVDVSARSKALSGLSISSNKTFTLEVTDERGSTDTDTTSINFVNGVYYGVIKLAVEIDSSVILGLTRKLQGSKGITFTANAGSIDRIAYALPARYGTPTFNVGGFDGGFYLAKTFDFTNASGYTESYNVWLSDEENLGSQTIKVS